jgi:hypothetical protein
MNRLLLATALFLAAGLLPAPAQPAGAPQWSVLELSVARPSEDKFASGYKSGTKVTVAVHLPGRLLAGLEPDKCKLLAFTDDRNTDLMAAAAPDKFRTYGLASRGLHVSNDCAHGAVVFHAPGLPAAGATKIRIKVDLVVRVGKDEKTIEEKNVALPLGVNLPFGTLKMSEAGLSHYLNYSGDRPLKSLVLLDAAGKEIPFAYPSKISGGLQQTAKDKANYHYSGRFYLKSRINRCTVRVTYFETVETIRVPLDIEASVGF